MPSITNTNTNTRHRNVSYQIALGGIITSLCVIGMFLTGVIPTLYLILPMISSILIYIMTIETDASWGMMTYVSVGLLSLFITPNKDASIVFIIFFGYYPVLRPVLDQKLPKALAFLIRLAIFNGAVMVFFYTVVYLLGAKELLESLGKYGKYGGYIMLGIANIMYISYDYIIAMFPQLYREDVKPRIFPASVPIEKDKKKKK